MLDSIRSRAKTKMRSGGLRRETEESITRPIKMNGYAAAIIFAPVCIAVLVSSLLIVGALNILTSDKS